MADEQEAANVEGATTPEGRVGEIHIRITNDEASYESQMSPPEIFFWMDMIKYMIAEGIVRQSIMRPDSPEQVQP